jgi:electron transfer flavoprotein alpha subunit
MSVLVVVEHDRGALAPATTEALTAAARLGAGPVVAVTVGAAADVLVDALGAFGADEVVQVHHDLLTDYGPEAWSDAMADVVRVRTPLAVLACGTDRGNEVMAHLAAILDLPFVANCLEVAVADGPWPITRVRWGGSLLERCQLEASVKLVSVAHHAVAAEERPVTPVVSGHVPALNAHVARTTVVDRVERQAGVTLATSPLVVGGGRGVGSAEAFAPLEELAGLLGGVVGCSRAVTNNGWRNHTDQVGQTGTRIAPDLYIACGISGAIQHWVGAMASKRILAINTDGDANMVTKADYAVIGDLHQVVPAISAEIRRRRGG